MSQPKRAMRALQASSAKIEVADQGFDSQNRTKGTYPQAQWSQLHTVEIASFRLTSASMEFPPSAVIGASSLRSMCKRDLYRRGRNQRPGRTDRRQGNQSRRAAYPSPESLAINREYEKRSAAREGRRIFLCPPVFPSFSGSLRL